MSQNVYPIAFLDPPNLLQAGVTNIPPASSLPLQVVADLGFNASYAIDYIDSTGDYIGVYTGLSGQEKLNCVVGGGLVNRTFSVIAAHSRVSLRSMTNTAVTNGSLMMTFMGFKWQPPS